MYKPRLKYVALTHQWECFGKDIIRFGGSPQQAYIKWRLENDRQKYLETEICRFHRLKNEKDVHWYTDGRDCADSKV